ncbi:hypothetical protein VPH35_046847 [Triticum aestivum]
MGDSAEAASPVSRASSARHPLSYSLIHPHLQPRPLRHVVTNVARSDGQAGDRFYKCMLYDARQCRFFELQQAYCRRMTPHQIATTRRQARINPAGQGSGVYQGNGVAQMVPVATQAQIQAQAPHQVQTPPPAASNLIAEADRPAAVAGAVLAGQGLVVVSILMVAVNIMLTALVMVVVLAK